MTEQRLDDGSGFVIHSEKDNIWDKLKTDEAFKFEDKLQEAIQYSNYHNRIEALETPADCKEMEFELMENNNIHLKRVIKTLWNELEAIKTEINNTIAFEKSEKYAKESVSDTIRKYKDENKRNFQHRN